MKIELLHYTPVDVLAQATAMPYQSEPSEGLVRRVWEKGHRSIARHGMISFAVYGVSVSLLTQISRHPHINLTVQSSRYCDMSEQGTVIPPFVGNLDSWEYLKDMDFIKSIYRKWNKKEGYTKKERQEISKMFLPKASTLDLVVSGNYQAMYEFLQLRTCARAEWEIRKLAYEILQHCENVMPVIFGNCGPKCDICREPCENHSGAD